MKILFVIICAIIIEAILLRGGNKKSGYHSLDED